MDFNKNPTHRKVNGNYKKLIITKTEENTAGNKKKQVS